MNANAISGSCLEYDVIPSKPDINSLVSSNKRTKAHWGIEKSKSDIVILTETKMDKYHQEFKVHGYHLVTQMSHAKPQTYNINMNCQFTTEQKEAMKQFGLPKCQRHNGFAGLSLLHKAPYRLPMPTMHAEERPTGVQPASTLNGERSKMPSDTKTMTIW